MDTPTAVTVECPECSTTFRPAVPRGKDGWLRLQGREETCTNCGYVIGLYYF